VLRLAFVGRKSEGVFAESKSRSFSGGNGLAGHVERKLSLWFASQAREVRRDEDICWAEAGSILGANKPK
jgi:hypothetical protein